MRFKKASAISLLRHIFATLSMVALVSQAVLASTYTWGFVDATEHHRRGPILDSLLTPGKMDWNSCAGCIVDGYSITYVQNGAIALLRNHDLKCGITEMNAKIAWNNGPRITVHLDSAHASPICTLSITSNTTPNGPTVHTNQYSTPRGFGVHDVFVKYSGNGSLGDFYWLQFVYGCSREAGRVENWIPMGRPADGDSISISGAPANSRDTIEWNLGIRPRAIELNATRTSGIRFDSLHNAGVDTLHIGKLALLKGFIAVPAGFVIAADEADTNGIALPQGEYTVLSCRSGLAYDMSFGGGGKLLVGSAVGVARQTHRQAQRSASMIRVLDNGHIVASDKARTRIDLYSSKGNLVRRGGVDGIAVAGLPMGSYLVRATFAGHVVLQSIVVAR